MTTDTESAPAPIEPRPGLETIPDPAFALPAQAFTIHGEPDKLFAAIAKARGEFTQVKKDATGTIGNREFKYTTLAGLTEASIPALSKHGVVPLQFLEDPPGVTDEAPTRQVIRTIVAGHGARIESLLSFTRQSSVADYGKQTTYLRRYAYNAIFCMDGVEDADEDGGKQPMNEKKRTAPKPAGKNAKEAKQPKAPPPADEDAPNNVTQLPPPKPVSSRPPEEVPGDSRVETEVSAATKKKVGLAFKKVVGSNKILAAELCQHIVGKTPGEISEEDGEKLLTVDLAAALKDMQS